MGQRQGKIARIPVALRELLNQRILDGEKAGSVLAWLNSLAEVQDVLQAEFDGAAVTPQNLSDWRSGGYQDWLEDRREITQRRAQAEWAFKLAQAAGPDLATAAQRVIAGDILAQVQSATAEEQLEMMKSLAVIRGQDQADGKLALQGQAEERKSKELALNKDKFEKLACEKVYQAAKSKEVQEILNSGKPKAVQMDLLRKQLFG